jgi:hypothetical protein
MNLVKLNNYGTWRPNLEGYGETTILCGIRKLHIEELHDVNSSLSIVKIMKSPQRLADLLPLSSLSSTFEVSSGLSVTSRYAVCLESSVN